jgi:hypothetical protein
MRPTNRVTTESTRSIPPHKNGDTFAPSGAADASQAAYFRKALADERRAVTEEERDSKSANSKINSGKWID